MKKIKKALRAASPSKADALAQMIAMAARIQDAANHIAYREAQIAKAMRDEMKRMDEVRAEALADRARVERMNIAATALNGILASRPNFKENTTDMLARAAVECADALIAALGVQP